MVFSASDALEGMHAAQQQGMIMRMLSLGSSPGSADMLAGGGLSRLSAIGRPMGSAAMGMMGLDPMSLGMRAGMGAWNMGGGLMGAGMAGIGVAAGAGILGVGAQWAGGQMMTGAQQQLGLNMAMRQNFNFMNSQGGMGFTSNQGFQVGDALRGMAGVAGPGGEFQTFGELSKLAANMGRMGMGQNVRTVQEFKENFKKMLDTVKTIAHDMGTSLEEAQKMMVSMKNSGIFQKADQIRLSGGMRMGGLATGLAMSEFSGAANIGSQISRSIGGLGRQGAFAGMRTMEQIGMAQRVGAINEEDIYNATGLNGAEGRQALAAAQMQQSASFLQSGRGRRFLASIAGQNGTLNMDAVNEWMAGGNMTTGRTMELAHQNLAGVGRANFIRNEGRLRGAALEKFGGLAQSMVYKQWLGSRGFDANDMDDRAMLAFQRFSGMGRDEADLAIKQIQSLPQQMAAMQAAEAGRDFGDMKARLSKTQGIEGLKRKFELAREHIQDKMQHVGAKILESGTDAIESWFNHTMGIYTTHTTEGIEEIARNMEMGGAGAKDMYRRHFGGGGSFGGIGVGESNLSKYLGNQNLKMAAMVGSNDAAVAAFGKNNADFMKISAIGSSGKTPQEALASFRSELAEKAKTSDAAKDILAKFNAKDATDSQRIAMLQTMQEQAGVVKGSRIYEQINKQVFEYTPGGANGQTEAEFRESIGRRVLGMDAEGQSAQEKYSRSSWYNKAAGAVAGGASIVGGLLKKGIGGEYAQKSFSEIVAEGNEVTGSVAGGLEKFEGRFNGTEDYIKGAADVFMDRGTKELVSDVMAGGEGGKKAASSMLDLISTMRGQGEKLTKADRGKMAALAGVYVGSQNKEGLEAYQTMLKGGKITKAQRESMLDMATQYNKLTGENLDVEEAMKRMSAASASGGAAMSEINAANLASDFDRIKTKVQAEREAGVASGRLSFDAKTQSYSVHESVKKKRAESGLSKEAIAAAEMADRLVTKGLDAPIGKDDEAAFAEFQKKNNISADYYKANKAEVEAKFRHSQYYDDQGNARKSLANLSLLEKKKLASLGGKAGELAGMEAGLEEKFAAGSKVGGDVAGLASMLGISVDKSKAKNWKGTDADINEMLKAANIDNPELQKQLSKILKDNTKAGGKAHDVAALMQNMSEDDKKKLQEAKSSSEDPQYRAINDIRTEAKRQTEYLKGILAATSATQFATSEANVKNAENKK